MNGHGKHERTNLVSFLKEFFSVLQLKVVIVLVSLWSEPDFLNFLLNLLSLKLLGAFLLLVQEFAVVDETTNRRLGVR